jgi:hypothetical protein
MPIHCHVIFYLEYFLSYVLHMFRLSGKSSSGIRIIIWIWRYYFIYMKQNETEMALIFCQMLYSVDSEEINILTNVFAPFRTQML